MVYVRFVLHSSDDLTQSHNYLQKPSDIITTVALPVPA